MNSAILFATLGGLTIGLAAVVLYLGLGRIAGISGILSSALRGPKSNLWALLFVVGLGIGGWLASAVNLIDPATPTSAITGGYPFPVGWLVAGGLLVGFGTRMGSGCTSGHGVCGTARLSPRSIAATLTFLLVGMATATTLHGLGVIA